MFGRYRESSLFFASVIVSAYAAAVINAPECSGNEVRCEDGRCVAAKEECSKIYNALSSTLNTTNKACTLPPHPKNGRRTVTSSSLDHVEIHFVCNPGFTLKGSASARCENGGWQNEFPTCRKRYSAGCELKKHPKYVFKCEREYGNFSSCDQFEAVGTNVRVTRRVASDTGSGVGVELYCTGDGVLNISLGCMKEIEGIQGEIESFSINQQIAYENDFNKINPAEPEFKKLIKNFTNFQNEVRAKLSQMHKKIDECNIYHDLLFNNMNQPSQSAPHHNTDQSCTLPPNPTNGSYSVLTTLDEELYSENVDLAIRYVCDPGFALAGRDTPRCIGGIWKDEFPKCVAACKLSKKPEFVFQCHKVDADDDSCEEYVAVGSVVTVSRHQETPTAAPVSVTIACLGDRTFNLSQNCVEEFDNRQREFEGPVMKKITSYETIFNDFKNPIETGPKFESVVQEFHNFEKNVTTDLTRMNMDAKICDLHLDLILSSLTHGL